MGEYADQALESQIPYNNNGLGYARTTSVKQQLNSVASRFGYKGYQSYYKHVHSLCDGPEYEKWLQTDYAVPKGKNSQNNKIRYCLYKIRSFKKLLKEGTNQQIKNGKINNLSVGYNPVVNKEANTVYRPQSINGVSFDLLLPK